MTTDELAAWSNDAQVVRARIKSLETKGFSGIIPLTTKEDFVLAHPNLAFMHKLMGTSLADLTRVVEEQPGKLWAGKKGQS